MLLGDMEGDLQLPQPDFAVVNTGCRTGDRVGAGERAAYLGRYAPAQHEFEVKRCRPSSAASALEQPQSNRSRDICDCMLHIAGTAWCIAPCSLARR
jgi:hypothetical protein